MDKNTKDQLVAVLDRPAKRNYYGYTVDGIHNRPDLPEKHTLSWDVQLFPKNDFIRDIEDVIEIAKSVYPGVMVFMDLDDKSHLLLR